MKSTKICCTVLAMGVSLASFAKSENTDTKVIPIQLENLEDLSDKIEDVTFVALESNEDAVIDDFVNIKYYNDLLYIHNDGGNEIFIFDKNGKYINTFDKHGQDRGYYVALCNYTVDASGISIYDNLKNKLLVYNHKHELKNSYDMGNGERNFIKHNNQFILFDDFTRNNKISFSTYNEKAEFISKIEFNYQRNKFFNPSYQYIASINNQIYATLPFDYNLYHLDQQNKQVDISYTIDFGNDNIPKNFRKDNLQNMNIGEEYMALHKNHKATGIENIIQYKNWIIAYIDAYKGGLLCYSLKEQKVYSLSKTDDIFDCMDKSIYTNGNVLIGTIQPHYYAMFKKNQKDAAAFVDPYTKKLLQLPVIDEEDNPIICFIKLKE